VIDRYSRPEISKLWSLENKFQTWLEIEILACEAQAELGIIPQADLKEIKTKARFDLNRIAAIEAEVHHDVIAFLTSVNEFVGEPGRFIHFGLTSSDIGDTALTLTIKRSLDIILSQAERLQNALKTKSLQYKKTPCIGRSHGIHAEPTTFGLKLALFYEAIGRAIARLKAARKNISVGKLSGAVGTFSNIDPFVEEYVCAKLGLKPALIATQVIQRDRHAEVMSAIAIFGATLDQLATEIRSLQKTEVREVEEPFRKGQKGSSAMPHKRNPILCERISGLARVLKSNLQAALENVTLWHERDISHSSVERVILPDSTILLDYLIDKMVFIIENLHVYPQVMEQNINRTRGLIFSQKLLLLLVESGLTREEAYTIIQDNAMRVWQDNSRNLRDEISIEVRVKGKITPKKLDEVFDIAPYLSKVDWIFERAGITD
jgi:adenylosuccinate lyase